MKFDCAKDDLAGGVAAVRAAVPGKTTIPVLQNVAVEADGDGNLRFAATDLEVAIRRTVSAKVEVAGGLTVPGDRLHEIVGSLDGKDAIQVNVTDGGRLVIRSGKARFMVAGIPLSEYPAMPGMEGLATFSVGAGVLEEAIRLTLFSASSDESRHILNGVLFDSSGDVLTLAATDGRCIAVNRRPLTGMPTFRVVVPRKVLLEAQRALAEVVKIGAAGTAVEFGVSDGRVGLKVGGTTMVSRLVEGQFPDYRQIMREQDPITFRVGVDALREVCRRATLAADLRGACIRWKLGDGTLGVTSKSPTAEFDDEIQVQGGSKQPLDLGLNPAFVLAGMAALKAGQVDVGLVSSTDPVMFRAIGGADWAYAVMPMRI